MMPSAIVAMIQPESLLVLIAWRTPDARPRRLAAAEGEDDRSISQSR